LRPETHPLPDDESRDARRDRDAGRGTGEHADLDTLDHRPRAGHDRHRGDGERADRAGSHEARRIDRTFEPAAAGYEAHGGARDALTSGIDRLGPQLQRVADGDGTLGRRDDDLRHRGRRKRLRLRHLLLDCEEREDVQYHVVRSCDGGVAPPARVEHKLAIGGNDRAS
jgi:hypothetical protein